MGNTFASTVRVGIIIAATTAAFLFGIPSLAAADHDNRGRPSFAEDIISMVNKRLCDRQQALAGRLPIQLIHPSKCFTQPNPDEPTVTLTADPQAIDEGESALLEWDSTDADECVASDGWSGTKSTSGSQTVSPSETTTYSLECEGDGGTGSDEVMVTVTPAEEPEDVTVEITANPMNIIEGGSSTLTWNSDNADSCTASGGWTGDKAVDGSQSVSPTATTTYTIECEGDGGTDSDSVTVGVSVDEPEMGTLIVRKLVIRDDGDTSATTTFSFKVNNGATTTFESDGENSMSVVVGSYSVVENAASGFTTSYNNCSNVAISDGETEICIITNNDVDDTVDPTVSITASRMTVTEGSVGGATTTLTWNSSDATECVASNGWSGTKAVDGSETVTPTATTTYAITCTGDGGEANDSVTVNFVGEVEPEEANIVINEIAWMGMMVNGATTTAAEWIELRNLGANQVDMNGWTLTLSTTSTATPDKIVISSSCTNTVIASGGYYLLLRNSIATSSVAADCVYPGSASTAMSNSGEILTLLDAGDVSIDSVDGSDGWEIGGPPQKGDNDTKDTAQRADNGSWFTAAPTPRAAN